MNGFRATLRVLAVALTAAAAAPAHAQAPADAAGDAVAVPVLAYQWPAPVRHAPQPTDDLAPAADAAPTLLAVSVEAIGAEDARRMSVGGYTAAGAVLGALLGTAALYLTEDGCTETGSMCGLAIPLYAGGGAVAGGLVGYLIGRSGS